MTHQELYPSTESNGSALKARCDHHFHTSPDMVAAGFSIWWNKTLVNHLAVVEQAFYLMRAHRRINSATVSQAR